MRCRQPGTPLGHPFPDSISFFLPLRRQCHVLYGKSTHPQTNVGPILVCEWGGRECDMSDDTTVPPVWPSFGAFALFPPRNAKDMIAYVKYKLRCKISTLAHSGRLGCIAAVHRRQRRCEPARPRQQHAASLGMSGEPLRHRGRAHVEKLRCRPRKRLAVHPSPLRLQRGESFHQSFCSVLS